MKGKAHDPVRQATWSSRFLLLCLFLLVLGARLWLVQTHSTPLPFWDQWDGEGAVLIKPWLEGHLRFSVFFVPHNEHRIVLTRLLALGLFIVNGQWDAQLEMAVNAVLCAATAGAIAFAAQRIFPARQQLAIGALVGLLFVLPFAWENTLAGFQSQFYFLLIFSLVALWGFCICAPLSVGWWIGITAAALACLSMSSGFLVAAAFLGLFVFRFFLRRERWNRAEAALALFSLVLLAIGLTTRVTVPLHAALQADSIRAFLVTFGRSLAWPLIGSPWFAIPLQMPLLILAFRYGVAARGTFVIPRSRPLELLLATGLWVWLQTAAIAFARGGSGLPPASRYQDLLALGLLLNFLCLAFLLWQSEAAALKHRISFRLILAGAWIFLCAVGLIRLTIQNFQSDLPERRRLLLAEVENVRGYLATGDFDRYLAGKPLMEIPYPVPETLAGYLSDPVLRRVLPYNVREALPLESAQATTPAEQPFLENAYPDGLEKLGFRSVWGSWRAEDRAEKRRWDGVIRPTAGLPYLCFAIAGELDGRGLSLRLRKATDKNAKALAVADHSLGRNIWWDGFVPLPGPGPLAIVAKDHHPSGWFAFAAPTEVGRLSYWAQRLLNAGRSIFLFGICLACTAGLLSHLVQNCEENHARPARDRD